MILTQEQTRKLIGSADHYDCTLIHKRFGWDFLKENVSPLGNVLTFQSPIKLGPLEFNDAITVCGEIINTPMFGGVCFQRLYLAQLGSFLSQTLNIDTFVDGNVLIIDGKQASINLINSVKNCVTFHFIFPIVVNMDNLNITPINMSPEQAEEFKIKAVETFHLLLNNIFVDTQRDNF